MKLGVQTTRSTCPGPRRPPQARHPNSHHPTMRQATHTRPSAHSTNKIVPRACYHVPPRAHDIWSTQWPMVWSVHRILPYTHRMHGSGAASRFKSARCLTRWYIECLLEEPLHICTSLRLEEHQSISDVDDQPACMPKEARGVQDLVVAEDF